MHWVLLWTIRGLAWQPEEERQEEGMNGWSHSRMRLGRSVLFQYQFSCNGNQIEYILEQSEAQEWS